MPEEEYSFRPATTVRSYGQLIGHIIDAHYLFCGPLSAESKAPPDAEKKLTSKADLVKSLKESVGYCNAAIERLTDAQAAETVKFFGRDKARLSVLYMNIAHDNEHYGNLVTYLRIKGLVPPSSEPRQTSQLGRLYFDLAHGQMASLFLGVPEGQRLTGKPRAPQGTTYWGKDSAVFMEEVIAWLVNR